MSRRDPDMAVRHMRDHAAEAVALVARRRRSDLDTNRVLRHAFVRLVEMVGEAATRIPADVQRRHANIPWADIVGMRNRLIHGYDEVDLDVLWTTLQEDLPSLVRQLDVVLRS